MPHPKPPPRTLNSDDERKVQQFLERAAPIVLENPALTAERWQRLAAIAADLELTADEFRSTLDDLMHRGVLKQIDVRPAKPPPLPGRTTPPWDSPPPADLPQDAEFSLAPPPVVGRRATTDSSVSPPPRTLTEKPNLDVGAAIEKALTDRTPPDKPLADKPPPDKPLGDKPLGDKLGANRPLGDKAADKTAEKTAAEKAALERAAADKVAGRWRIEGAPAPIPPPPPKKPFETYLDFVRPSLAPCVATRIVPEELENRLLQHGVKLLGLSPVYARHLLQQAARDKDLTLPSQADSASKAPVAESLGEFNPRWRAFAAAAMPILTQHRGFTAQSRVLLNAVAREQGLSESEMEAAVAALAPVQTATLSESELAQQERLVPYRADVQTALEKLPRRILVPSLLDKLTIAGTELYGLDGDTVYRTIREVAGQLKVAVITMDQAEQHVMELVAGALGNEVLLQPKQIERIHEAAAQWGLPTARVDQLIRGQSDANREAQRLEQATTKWALIAAGAAVFFVLAFLVFVAIRSQSDLDVGPPTVQVEPRPDPILPPALPETDDAWWGVGMALAVEKARDSFPGQQNPLNNVAARDASTRQSAYQQLVAQFLNGTTDTDRRKLLMDVLSGSLARDPSDVCAEEVANSLLRIIPDPGARLPEDAGSLATMFWSVRTITSAMSDKAISTARAKQLADTLGRTLGFVLDPAQPAATIEKTCLGGLADRVFRMLIATAATSATNLPTLHATVAAEAAGYLDPASLDKLNAEFLVTVLNRSAESWRQYEELVRATVASPEPLAVLKLLELYELTSNPELQDYLRQQLLARTSTDPPGYSVEQVVAHVRQALGISATMSLDDQWKKLSREAESAIAAVQVKPEILGESLADVTRLTYYSTLACALANSAWADEATEVVRKAGPQRPVAKEAPPEEATYDVDRREIVNALTNHIKQLNQRRLPPSVRLDAIQSMARMTETVADIPPEIAAGLAGYLLGTKPAPEQNAVFEQLAALARWNQLLVAVADRLDDSSMANDQLQEFLSRLLGRSVTVGEGRSGRLAARAQVWQLLVERLGKRDTTITTGTDLGSAAEALLYELYKQQARMLKVGVPESATALATPAAVLQAMIREQASRLSDTATTEAAKRELARVSYDLTAAEYVAANDPQLLALLERVWLRLLAIDVARRDERHAAEAQQLVLDLDNRDLAAKHLVDQLRNGQAALLRMWLLAGKRG